MGRTYTTAQVAEVLQIDPTEASRLIRAGRIRGFRATPGRTAPWRVTEDALAEYITTQEQAAHAA